MTIYDINILQYEDSKTYKKDNIVIKDNMFFQALKDIESDAGFNINDWKIINDPNIVFGNKLFPDYLNLENDNKPSSNNIPDTGTYSFVGKVGNRFKQYITPDKGITWIEQPISNYNNLSIYLTTDKYLFNENNEISKNLNKLQINDELTEIVFYHNFGYPITDNSIVHELVFDKCIIKFSKTSSEAQIRISVGNNEWVLVDSVGTPQNINTDSNVPDWLYWNPGTRTLEFYEKLILTNLKDGNGNGTNTNNLPDLATYIPFVETWVLNDEIIEINYDNNGANYEIMNYTPTDLIKKIVIGNNPPQILTPTDKQVTLPFVDTGSNTAGIIKPTSSSVSFTDGVMEVTNTNPTVYMAFDYGCKDTSNPNDPTIWTGESIPDGKTMVLFQTRKWYTMYGGDWESEKDLNMSEGQCVFVDRMVVKDPDTTIDDITYVPNITWLNKNNFSYLNSDPTYVQHRTQTWPINIEESIEIQGVDSITKQLDPPIDNVLDIKSIHIHGTYTFTVFEAEEEGDPNVIKSETTIPFNFNSLHGEFKYRVDDLNVNRMLVGLSYNPMNTVNLDDTLNEIYFLSEPTGYVKSISTFKNYSPFYLPKEIYSTGFTKGIKLGVSPPTGTGNVYLGWDFAPIVARGYGTSILPVGSDKYTRKVKIEGTVTIEWNENI